MQAVARQGARAFVDPQDFIAYLDSVMAANPSTRTWNFSLNRRLTFSYARHLSIIRQFLTYAASNSIGIAVSFIGIFGVINRYYLKNAIWRK